MPATLVLLASSHETPRFDVYRLNRSNYVSTFQHCHTYLLRSEVCNSAVSSHASPYSCDVIARLLYQTSTFVTWLPVTSYLCTNKNTVPDPMFIGLKQVTGSVQEKGAATECITSQLNFKPPGQANG